MEKSQKLRCFLPDGAVDEVLYGWRAGRAGLYVPRGVTQCGVMCVDVEGAIPWKQAAESLLKEARRVRAKALFLMSGEGADIQSLSAVLQGHIALYSDGTAPIPGTVPVYRSPEEHHHTDRNYAVYLPCRNALTSLIGKIADRKTLDRKTLDTLLQVHKPRPMFSEELCAYYFTVKQNSGTLFCVYDTEETLKKRIARCLAKGACACFVYNL